MQASSSFVAISEMYTEIHRRRKKVGQVRKVTRLSSEIINWIPIKEDNIGAISSQVDLIRQQFDELNLELQKEESYEMKEIVEGWMESMLSRADQLDVYYQKHARGSKLAPAGAEILTDRKAILYKLQSHKLRHSVQSHTKK